jgi:hypothetical protein
MLFVMQTDATQVDIDRVGGAITDMGYQAVPMPGVQRTAIGLVGNDGRVDDSRISALPGVAQDVQSPSVRQSQVEHDALGGVESAHGRIHRADRFHRVPGALEHPPQGGVGQRVVLHNEDATLRPRRIRRLELCPIHLAALVAATPPASKRGVRD